MRTLVLIHQIVEPKLDTKMVSPYSHLKGLLEYRFVAHNALLHLRRLQGRRRLIQIRHLYCRTSLIVFRRGKSCHQRMALQHLFRHRSHYHYQYQYRHQFVVASMNTFRRYLLCKLTQLQRCCGLMSSLRYHI